MKKSRILFSKQINKKMHPLIIALTGLSACLLAGSVSGEEGKTTKERKTEQKPEVRKTEKVAVVEEKTMKTLVIKGQNMSPKNDAFSVTRIDPEDIRARSVDRIQDMFQFVPGMEVRGLQIGGVADSITLRGFAGGGHGGDIGVVIDGIPLNEATSHADGYVDLNMLIPLELGATTVFRGPVSALYGNFNRAGVLAYETRKGGTYLLTDMRAGSFGMLDGQAAVGYERGALKANFAAQGFMTNGYRANSDFDRRNFSGRVQYDINDRIFVALSGRYSASEWDSVSRVTQSEFDDRRRRFGMSPNSMNDGGDKEYKHIRGDIGIKLLDNVKLLAFAYGVDQEFLRFSTQPIGGNLNLPASWRMRKEDYSRSVLGVGANINGKHDFYGPINWVIGGERYEEDTGFRYRDGLNFRADTINTTNNRFRLLDRTQRFNTWSGFGQVEWAPSPYFRPNLGLRYDSFDGNCRRDGVELPGGFSAIPVPCNALNEYSRLNPKLGVRSTIWPGIDIRGSYSEGFQLPSDIAKYSTGGQVSPTVFRQYEAGVNVTLLKNMLFDLAFFRIDSDNEVFTLNAQAFNFTNLGRTRREGMEIDFRYAPFNWIELAAVSSIFTSEVLNSPVAGVTGKHAPNTPRHMETVSATLRHMGWSLRGNYRIVGAYDLDALNTRKYEGYDLLDLTLAWQPETPLFGKRTRFMFRVDNLLDKVYAPSASVVNNQMVYAPGAPRSYLGSIQVDF